MKKETMVLVAVGAVGGLFLLSRGEAKAATNILPFSMPGGGGLGSGFSITMPEIGFPDIQFPELSFTMPEVPAMNMDWLTTLLTNLGGGGGGEGGLPGLPKIPGLPGGNGGGEPGILGYLGGTWENLVQAYDAAVKGVTQAAQVTEGITGAVATGMEYTANATERLIKREWWQWLPPVTLADQLMRNVTGSGFIEAMSDFDEPAAVPETPPPVVQQAWRARDLAKLAIEMGKQQGTRVAIGD